MIKQRSNLTLPVSLYAIGNVKDELNLHTGELTHRIGKVVFDGTEHWSIYTSGASGIGVMIGISATLAHSRANGG